MSAIHALLVAFGLLVGAHSHADPKPSVVVHIDRCLAEEGPGAVDRPTFHESLAAELGPGLELRGEAAAMAGDTQLLIDCSQEDPASLHLRIIDPLTGSAIDKQLAAPDSASSERAAESLARSVAALLRSLWTDLSLDREDEARARPGTLRRARRIARRPANPWLIGDAFVARSFLGADAPAWMLGEQVLVVHRPLRHLAWRADGELALRRVPVTGADGSLRVNTTMISVAPSLLAWTERPGSGPRGAGTAAIYGGAGMRIGGVRMRDSDGGPGSDGFQIFAGPLATTRVSVSLGRYVGVALDLEAGWALVGPRHPQYPLALQGPWLAGALVLSSNF
ncbi:MAG: hypothetical protein KC431_13615 [Myxococcales bacterium]|nr:hypothetical protein [Myxococcales bacterium]